MDVSTRPSQKRRQHLAQHLCGLAAFVCAMTVLAGFQPSARAATELDLPAPEAVSSIAQDASHEVAIRNVAEGEENLSLTARLSTAGNTLAQDISWQVRTDEGELVLNDTRTELPAKLAPGAYVIEALYGAVNIRENLTLPKGHALSVSFVLNAGGLRVLPMLKNLSTTDQDATTLVYALSGPQKGKLITHSNRPGEILKLAAGQYRIENRFGSGNTMAVTDVRIKPGRISAVEIRHNAGVARLSYVGAASASVVWQISSDAGERIAEASGLNHAFVLRPGTYLAEAQVDGETLTARFRISIGEERDIMLGN